MFHSLLGVAAGLTLLAAGPQITNTPDRGTQAGVQIRGTVSKYDPATNVVTVRSSDGKEHEIRLTNRTRLVEPRARLGAARRPARAAGEDRPVLSRLREVLREGANVSVNVDREGDQGTATEIRLGADRTAEPGRGR